mgnify:CR=1 FL=1
MYYTGIDFEENQILFATINNKCDLIDLKTIEIASKKHRSVKQIYNKPTQLTSSLSGKDVLIKTENIKSNKKKEIHQIIQYQKQSLNTLNDASFLVLSETQKQSKDHQAIYYISKESHVKNHLNKLKEFNIDPDRVTCDTKALSQFISTLYPNKSYNFVIHIKKLETLCVVIKDNHPIFSYHFKLGNKHLETKLIDWENEVTKAGCSFQSKLEDQHFRLLITGQNQNYAEKEIDICKKHPQIFYRTNNNSSLENKYPLLRKYAISIGIALESTLHKNSALQFRSLSNYPKKLIKQAGMKFSAFFALSLLVSTFLFTGTNWLTKKSQKQFQQTLVSLSENEKNIFNNKIQLDPNKNLKDNLYLLENEIYKNRKNFPYLNYAKTASDFLSWFNNQNFLKNYPEISIQSFSYQLLNYPNLNNIKSPNLVRIEINFNANNQQMAKKFYNALSQERKMINTSKDIHWSQTEESYKISFFLNNNSLIEGSFQ